MMNLNQKAKNLTKLARGYGKGIFCKFFKLMARDQCCFDPIFLAALWARHCITA
jgi:hypothetical protein